MAGGCRVVLEVDVPASAGLHDPVGGVEPAGAVDPVEGGEVVVGRSGHAVVLLGDRGEGQGPAGGEGVGRKGCWSRGPPVVGGWRMLMSFAGSGGQAVTQVALTEQEDHDGGDHRDRKSTRLNSSHVAS